MHTYTVAVGRRTSEIEVARVQHKLNTQEGGMYVLYMNAVLAYLALQYTAYLKTLFTFKLPKMAENRTQIPVPE